MHLQAAQGNTVQPKSSDQCRDAKFEAGAFGVDQTAEGTGRIKNCGTAMTTNASSKTQYQQEDSQDFADLQNRRKKAASWYQDYLRDFYKNNPNLDRTQLTEETINDLVHELR